MRSKIKIKIITARKPHIPHCIESVKHSELWKRYFAHRTGLEELYQAGIGKKEIFAAVDEKGGVLGYAWMKSDGCFYQFPYLCSLAVKKACRNRGVGARLLEHFEETGFLFKDRVFILVSDFNRDARRFYRRHGFKKVGLIPGLFEPDIAEILLVKYK